MMSAGAQSLRALLQRTTLDDHEEVLQACNTILKKSKTDTEAQHIRAVALLKLDRYEDALRQFDDAGGALKAKAPFEHAYTLYKVGKLEEAAQVAASVSGQRAARHVEAQASYRAEQFARTAQLYRALSSEETGFEEHDLRVNRGAVDAQLQWAGQHELVKSKKPGLEDLEVFETAYNAACRSIARAELGQAEALLKRANELCKHSEDLSAEEKTTELLPMNIQRVYVLERLGKLEDAKKIIAEIKMEDISDLSTRKIGYNNLLTSSERPSSPFVAYKMFNSGPAIPCTDKPFSFQARMLTKNAKTIDLGAFKFDGVAASTAKIISQQRTPTTSPNINTLSVLNAAALARCETGNAAFRRLLPELEKRSNDIGLNATIIQLYMLANNPTSAIYLLESLLKRLDDSVAGNYQDIRNSPGLVGILIALYRTQGRKSDSTHELAKAASYWRHKSNPPKRLLQAAGNALLESSSKDDVSTAHEVFTKLHEQYPDDKAIIAGYVASRAMQSPDDIGLEVEKLNPVSDLIQGVDVDALESGGIPQSSNALAIAQQGLSRKRAAADGSATRRKRIRKSRLPKDYDPSKQPDPERWLPLRDRSSYRPRGKKKGKKDGGDRTQGGVVNDDVDVKDSTSTPIKAPGLGGGNKKKRAKGKR